MPPAMGSTSRAISTSTVKVCCSTSPIAATPTTSLTRRLPIRAFPPKSSRGQKQLVQRRYDTLAGRAAQYDDWYTDVSFLGAETRYAGLTLEVYSFSQHYHAQKPEKILLAGGTEVDEDGWAFLDGDTVLDGPYIVCLMDGGTRRILEGSMSGDCSTGSPAYYADLTALLAKNNVLRPDALDGGRLNEAMSSGISFLNWLGQYDAAEQGPRARKAERLPRLAHRQLRPRYVLPHRRLSARRP